MLQYTKALVELYPALKLDSAPNGYVSKITDNETETYYIDSVISLIFKIKLRIYLFYLNIFLNWFY